MDGKKISDILTSFFYFNEISTKALEFIKLTWDLMGHDNHKEKPRIFFKCSLARWKFSYQNFPCAASVRFPISSSTSAQNSPAAAELSHGHDQVRIEFPRQLMTHEMKKDPTCRLEEELIVNLLWKINEANRGFFVIYVSRPESLYLGIPLCAVPQVAVNGAGSFTQRVL